ncbi:hypothetical protein ACHAWO_009682 [Cyclotella atomus]|uniref:Transmembrane protein n=1 Tax=Cyclotella atomus TaxID=382360 RepID=A0ABD3NU87_9STRA
MLTNVDHKKSPVEDVHDNTTAIMIVLISLLSMDVFFIVIILVDHDSVINNRETTFTTHGGLIRLTHELFFFGESDCFPGDVATIVYSRPSAAKDEL